jgi:hypothetical protein
MLLNVIHLPNYLIEIYSNILTSNKSIKINYRFGYVEDGFHVGDLDRLSLTVLVRPRDFVDVNERPVTSSIDGLVLNSKLGEIPGKSIVRLRRT